MKFLTDFTSALYSLWSSPNSSSLSDRQLSAISRQIEGTSEKSFRLAEAITRKAGLGLGIRLDASKDAIDMDAVRNGEMTFDDAWDLVIDFWAKFVDAVKKVI